ncbi:2-oxoglutarate and iron-dependent oxygenase domain-containing protein [Streptomyces sp. NPDC000594]|uniref:2-oxoglutarate and iron-dependent oxygenase domain-containing protein n=1 Tax=Streptomyces sp. NPDC000594 TaxID=3154261 RepID=UPI00332F8093
MSVLSVLELPETVTGSAADRALGATLIDIWRTRGIIQLATRRAQRDLMAAALRESRRFFHQPLAHKQRHRNDLTYSGYTGSGETGPAHGRALPEAFAVCKDVPADDQRTLSRWPCHGPVPWPDPAYRTCVRALLAELESLGGRILALTALGLGLEDPLALTTLTDDGWHHMRLLRFPSTMGSDAGRGIGTPFDYGLLLIAVQDDTGGLWVRPPAAGPDSAWSLTPPLPDVLTVLPGPVLQILSGGQVRSTPHRVRPTDRERHVIAYFHEPNFQALVQPLRHTRGGGDPLPPDMERRVHYGTHVTSMFMRCYPERLTTRRLRDEGGLDRLARLRAGAGLD